MSKDSDPENPAQAIKRRTRREYASEEKIRIVLEGLKGEQSISEVCRRESIQPAQCNSWSKEFLSNKRGKLTPPRTAYSEGNGPLTSNDSFTDGCLLI